MGMNEGEMKTKLSRAIRWFFYNSMSVSMAWFAFMDSQRWAFNALLFYTWLTAITHSALLNDKAAFDMAKNGRSFPAFLMIIPDAFIMLACAANAHWVMASAWAWIMACESYAFSKGVKNEA